VKQLNISASYFPDNIIALVIFLIVLTLIIVRKIRGLEFPIWSTMMIGASLMILTGVMSVEDAYKAIDFDVIFFLIGMFSIVAGVEKSGLLGYVMYRVLSPFESPKSLLIVFVILMGFLSALTVNDTMAIVGTLIVITIVKQMLLPFEDLLIALAFSITVGSVATPIGNPQNMLIASQSGIGAPFLSFVTTLGIPTLINLVIVAGFLLYDLRSEMKKPDGRQMVVILEEHIDNINLAKISGFCLLLAVGSFILNDLLGVLGWAHTEHLGIIAFLAAVPMFAFAAEKRSILQQLDWSSVVFFMSMFIVMGALWQSGAANIFLGLLPTPNPSDKGSAIISIMLTSTLLSQIFSNVPLVKLYIDVMKGLGFTGAHKFAWLALSSGSTVAGNLTILGAASNVIIIEAAENRTGRSFSFITFLKKGVIIIVINLLVYGSWLYFFG
jgi:Na+/H+ antiporter NhaD/arsenite permease-like protein